MRARILLAAALICGGQACKEQAKKAKAPETAPANAQPAATPTPPAPAPVGDAAAAAARVPTSNEETVADSALLSGLMADPPGPVEGAIQKQLFSRYMVDVKRCHREALARSPRSRGRVVLRFEVTEGGAVREPSVRGYDPALDACIAKAMKTWTFEKPPGPQVIEVPMLLEAN